MQKKIKVALQRADVVATAAICFTLIMGGASTFYAPSTDQSAPPAAPRAINLPTAGDIVAADVNATVTKQIVTAIPNRAPTEAELEGLKILAKTECLADAMYYEARGEGTEGQLAVAEVIYNRARDADYPSNICGVVFQGSHQRTGCQFSFSCNGEMLRPKSPAAWRRAQRLALRIVTGNLPLGDLTGEATSFHAVAVQPGWSDTMVRTTQIGNHVFYRPAHRYFTRGA